MADIGYACVIPLTEVICEPGSPKVIRIAWSALDFTRGGMMFTSAIYGPASERNIEWQHVSTGTVLGTTQLEPVCIGYPRGQTVLAGIFPVPGYRHAFAMIPCADVLKYVLIDHPVLKQQLIESLTLLNQTIPDDVARVSFTDGVTSTPSSSSRAMNTIIAQTKIPKKGIYVRIGSDTSPGSFNETNALTTKDISVSERAAIRTFTFVTIGKGPSPESRNGIMLDRLTNLDLFRLPHRPYDIFIRYEDALMFYPNIPLTKAQQKLVTVTKCTDPVTKKEDFRVSYPETV